MSYIFPEDYGAGATVRNQILSDILFSSNPPTIEEIIKSVPKSKSGFLLGVSNDYSKWDAWIKGPLNKIIEYRNNKDLVISEKNNKISRQQNTVSQHIIVNQLYNQIIKQNKQLEEQQSQIQELNAKIDLQLDLNQSQEQNLKLSISKQILKPIPKPLNLSHQLDEWDDLSCEAMNYL